MPSSRLLFPLTVTLALGLASPAMAFDWPVEVVNYEFKPGPRSIDVGDKVIWKFKEGDHSTTSRSGQPDSWDSGTKAANSPDFEHTFTKPGLYQYICTPHETFMKSTIKVGEDAETDTVDNFKGKRRGDSVKISYKLNEAATVTYKLKGRSGRTVKRPRRDAGRYSFRLRNLKTGEYRGKLTAVDDFDKKSKSRNFFVVR